MSTRHLAWLQFYWFIGRSSDSDIRDTKFEDHSNTDSHSMSRIFTRVALQIYLNPRQQPPYTLRTFFHTIRRRSTGSVGWQQSWKTFKVRKNPWNISCHKAKELEESVGFSLGYFDDWLSSQLPGVHPNLVKQYYSSKFRSDFSKIGSSFGFFRIWVVPKSISFACPPLYYLHKSNLRSEFGFNILETDQPLAQEFEVPCNSRGSPLLLHTAQCPGQYRILHIFLWPPSLTSGFHKFPSWDLSLWLALRLF